MINIAVTEYKTEPRRLWLVAVSEGAASATAMARFPPHLVFKYGYPTPLGTVVAVAANSGTTFIYVIILFCFVSRRHYKDITQKMN